MKRETVVVLDFGGQYNQLVARRVRECNVYCEIYSYKTDLEKIKAMNPKGIILTGGPNSCYEADSPTCNKELFELGIPVLGLCYGAQLMMHVLGGKVEKADVSEYGKTEVLVDKTDSKIFKDVSDKTICWMSHTDYISQVAPGFEIAAHTADCPVATAQNEEKKLYAIQFHPEVLHTVEGKKMLSNFVLGVCGCAGDWKMDAFVEHTIREIREKVGDGKVLLALSGGVDSSVAAGLLSRAIGKQLTCVFVDHGLLRKDEGDEVEGVFGPNGQFDFGGQYNQLVARRVRECNVYCEIYSYKTDIEKIKAMNPKGIILTGGPNSCYEPDSPTYSEELFKLGIPVLGLCYGAQLMSHVLGGKVERADVREYGKTEVIIDKKDSKVFEGVSETTTCWMSHFDYISQVAPGFEITAHTADCPVATAQNAGEEAVCNPVPSGSASYSRRNRRCFQQLCTRCMRMCRTTGRWMPLLRILSAEIREKVGDGRVLACPVRWG